jgi:thiol:disulfide interchange protein DsbA
MHKLFAILALALPLAAASYPVHALQPGDYQEVVPARLTNVGKNQIEVIEFFWYGCPHCFHLEPDLNVWAKKLPRNVVLTRVPAVLNEDWTLLTRAHYAMKAAGVLDKLHDDLFEAIHLNGMRFNNPTEFLDWAATKGIDRRKLADAMDSFSVNSEVMRAKQLTREYKLQGVPAIAVNGKYLTSASMTHGQDKLFKVVDELIAKERSKK